jgi:Cys-tRNA(Pro)/Cys-tRNA(Cys) deacylase
MTPAVRAAKKAGIQFQIHEYPHDSQASNAMSYGEEASTLLTISPDQVFKTLLISTAANINNNQLAVAIIPVSHQLNLKSAAKALGVKKMSMADPHEAEKATGYVLGGISPLGQKKPLPFVIDESVNNFLTVYVSGGRRGLQIELVPADLIRLCQAKVINCV